MPHWDPLEPDDTLDEASDGELDDVLIGTLLYEDAYDASLDWARFGHEVEARLDAMAAEGDQPDVLPSNSVLRTDEVDRHEMLDAPLAEETPYRLAQALRADFEAEWIAVEGRFAAFSTEVEDRIEALSPNRPNAAIEALSIAEALRDHVHDELRRRETDWTAFRTQLDTRMDRELRMQQARPGEEQAVVALRDDVSRELGEMAPHFDEGFKGAVDARVKEAPPLSKDWWWGLRRVLSRAFSFGEDGFGVATAAAGAAAVLLAVWGTSTTIESTGANATAVAGTVRVEEVSFEGSVAVMPQDGLTVVFLSESPEV